VGYITGSNTIQQGRVGSTTFLGTSLHTVFQNSARLADESAAALGEDRRTAGETCAVLLAAMAAAGRRASHAPAFWEHVENDRGAAAAGRLAKQK